MPSPLTKLAGAAANFSRSRLDLNETTGRPVPKLLTKDVHEVERLCRRGPPFSLSDLVGFRLCYEMCYRLIPDQPAYIDAVKNMNGTGIDDRKFLVGELPVYPDYGRFINTGLHTAGEVVDAHVTPSQRLETWEDNRTVPYRTLVQGSTTSSWPISCVTPFRHRPIP